MTMLGRGKRDADAKARKAEKARLKADEAARKAAEAAAEAERAAQEAEEAESAAGESPERDAETTATSKAAGKSPKASKALTREKGVPGADSEAADGAEDADDEPGPVAKAGPKSRAGAAAKTGTKGEPETPVVDPEAAPEADGEAGETAETAETAEVEAKAVPLEKKPVRKKTGDDEPESSEPDAADAGAEEDEEAGEDDEAGDEDEESEGKAAVEPAAKRGRRLPRLGRGRTAVWVLVAVNVVLVALLAWLVVALSGVNQEQGDVKAVGKVAFAAGQAAEDLSSYDYRTIDDDLKRATGHTTGTFHTEFAKMTATVKPSAVQGQTVVEGTAVKTAVESIEGDKAIALVYLDQQTAKGSSGERTPNQYTVRLVMKKVEGRWLVSELQMM